MNFQLSWLRTSHDELRLIKKEMYGRMQFRTCTAVNKDSSRCSTELADVNDPARHDITP